MRKILTIYEGTTAIQANDLVGPQDAARRRPDGHGRSPQQIEATEAELAASGAVLAARRGRQPARRRPGARSSTWSTSSWPTSKSESECGVRGLGAVPDARRHPAGAAGRWRAPCWWPSKRIGRGRRRRVHARQDRHGALLRRPHPAARHRACATASSRAAPASPKWRLSPSDKDDHRAGQAMLRRRPLQGPVPSSSPAAAAASISASRRTLLALGADIAICGRTQSKLDSAAAELRALGARVCPVAADVRDYAVLEERGVCHAASRSGRLTCWSAARRATFSRSKRRSSR